MQEKIEGLDPAIEALLNFNPPEDARDFYTYPTLTPPITFYDKHVDKRLSLQKVVLVPSLVCNFAQAVHRAFADIQSDDNSQLPSVNSHGFPTMRPQKIMDPTSDAKEIAFRYQIETSYPASVMASMLLLHPNSPTWADVFRIIEHSLGRRQYYAALNEDYAPQFLTPYSDEAKSSSEIPKEVWDAMDEGRQQEIIEARRRFRFLAVWQMFYIRREARRALKRMNSVTLMNALPIPSFRTLTPPCVPANLDLPPSFDAIHTTWGVPVAEFVNYVDTLSAESVADPTTKAMDRHTPRRSIRISMKLGNKEPACQATRSTPGNKAKNLAPSPLTAQCIFEWTNVTVPTRTDPTCTDDEMAMFILQHAWARAVERDATFIVLHCGTYERIALRHRSSRTLFISELIEVQRCSNPAYGAIHIGLFMSIVKDVLDRTRQFMDAENKEQPRKRKRKPIVSDETRKRPKTRAGVALETARKLAEEENFKAVCTEVVRRPLALLRIQHSHYNSPVPASFIRYDLSKMKIEKLTYKPQEYFCITLTSPLGIGGTGDAHEGVIDLMGPSGDSLSLPNIVVKFAFRPDERQRLRHEFKVYEHLKTSRVTGIPHHFGLFKDVEGDTLALVMTKGGIPLPQRKLRLDPDVYDPSFTVSKSERADFIKTLESIHGAGVRHRDIRGDNLVINEDGDVNIIDFDRASLKSREETMQREMEHLVSLLDGDHAAVGLEFVSRGSFRESELPSVDQRSDWEKSEDDSDRQHTAERDTNASLDSPDEGSGDDVDSQGSDSDESHQTVNPFSWSHFTAQV